MRQEEKKPSQDLLQLPKSQQQSQVNQDIQPADDVVSQKSNASRVSRQSRVSR